MNNCYRYLVLFFLLSFFSKTSSALIGITVTGNTNTTPALSPAYASLASAITAINGITAMSGPVTLNMAAGSTESLATQLLITNPGNTTHAISFVKSGVGANPKLTRTDAGTLVTNTVGALGDAVIRIDGTDNIHFNGLDIATSNQGIEYGFFAFRPSGANACKNMSIRNGVVTLTKGTSAFTIGIYLSNGPTTVSSRAGVTHTSAAGRAENITITGMTIQNVHTCINSFGSSQSAYRDLNFVIGSSGQGNVLQNFGGGNASTAFGINLYYVENTQVNYNTIQNSVGGTAHTNALTGILLESNYGTFSINNNTILLNTSSNSAVNWIDNDYHFGTGTIQYNQFGGSIAATATSYLIYNQNISDYNFLITDNSITGTLTKTGNSGSLYGYYNSSSLNKGIDSIRNNNFSNIVANGSSTIYGIYCSTNNLHTQVIHNNVISNYSTSTGFITGILSGIAGRKDIYNNEVFNLSGGSVVNGLHEDNGGLYYCRVLRNKVYNLSSTNTGTGTYVRGIYIDHNNTTDTIKVFNNLIANLAAPSANGNNAIIGLDISLFTGINRAKVYHNTIHFIATSTGTNFGTSGVYHNASSAPTIGFLDLRNNIISNHSIGKGTGFTAAYRRSNTAVGNFNPLSNNNLYYGGVPGPKQLIFTNGTQMFSDLAAYQTFMQSQVPGADQYSVTENINFLSLSGSSADFLKYDSTLFTLAESRGSTTTGLGTDFLGNLRFGAPDYTGTGLAPDLGAWELEGIPPVFCNGAPSACNTLASDTLPCTDSTFTLYLSLTYGIGHTYQWQKSSESDTSGFSSVPGATGTILTDTTHSAKWYRCMITCTASGQSVISTPIGIQYQPMQGTYIIDNTGMGHFISFAAAIQQLHCRGVSGPVTFEVVNGQVFFETSNLILSYNSPFPIKFIKQGIGTNPRIQRTGTSSTTNYILMLNGADHFTFDGIDFEQSGTGTSTFVELGIYIVNSSPVNGSRYNTFKNGTISLYTSNANVKGVYLTSQANPQTAESGTNSYNRFVNMVVQNAFTGYEIESYSSLFQDTDNEITTENGGFSIINTLGDRTTTGVIYGIVATAQSDFKIENTEIYSLLPGGTSLAYGIQFYYADSTNITIQNNYIHDIEGVGSVTGIAYSALATGVIRNNRISNLSTSYGLTSTATMRGIYSGNGDSLNIENNRIFNLSAGTGADIELYGIEIANHGNTLIANNMISDLRNGNSSTLVGHEAGIYINNSSDSGIAKLYHNTIYLNDVGVSSGFTSYCLYITNYSNTNYPIIDARNNLLLNMTQVGTGNTVAGILNYTSVDNWSSSCNNNIIYAGTPGTKYLIYSNGSGTNLQSIASFKSFGIISPAESMSMSEQTQLQVIGDGILRPDLSLPTVVESNGQWISTVAEDFEGEIRNSTTPDIGADEGTFSSLGPSCITYQVPANGEDSICCYENFLLRWSTPLNGQSVTGGYDLYFGTTPNPPLLTNVGSIAFNVPALLPNTTYYWKVIPKFSSGPATGCYTASFTTSATYIQSVQHGSRCGTGSVTLGVTGGGNFSWYSAASGGSLLATGPTYTPTVSSTTTYYVSTEGGFKTSQSVGAGYIASSGAQSTSNTDYIFFDALSKVLIESVVVYPGAAGNVVLQLRNSGGSTLATFTYAVTTSQINTPVTVPVNWTVNTGTGYRIYRSSSSVSLYRNGSGGAYPYVASGLVSINGSSSGSSFYYWAFNWKVKGFCGSPRVPVTATVNSQVNYKQSINACQSYTWSVNGQTYTQSGIYVHTVVAGAGCLQRDSLILSIYQPQTTTQLHTACGSYTWVGSGQTYTQTGIYTVTLNNLGGCDSIAHLDLTIIQCTAQLNVRLLLEGFYKGGGQMLPALFNQAVGNDTTLTDSVDLVLLDYLTLDSVIQVRLPLSTQGNTQYTYSNLPGDYYLIVRHRHTVETWSAAAITFGLGDVVVNYNFTDAASKAYGSNQQELEPGIFALYSGDVDGNGNIDLVDIGAIETDAANYAFGYFDTDINGDGNVDLLDIPFLENNIQDFVFSEHP